jgi:hypothetical protein
VPFFALLPASSANPTARTGIDDPIVRDLQYRGITINYAFLMLAPGYVCRHHPCSHRLSMRNLGGAGIAFAMGYIHILHGLKKRRYRYHF